MRISSEYLIKLKADSRRGMFIAIAGFVILGAAVVYSSSEVRRVQNVIALYSEGKQLLRDGQESEADEVFQRLLEVDPEFPLNFDDERDFAAELLLEQANSIIQERKDPEALTEAMIVREKARQLSPRKKIAEAKTLATLGEIPKAITLYEEVALASSSAITPGLWNSLCWSGAIRGYAAEVMFACNNAVEADSENGGFRDSRGLALALVGELEAAVKGFEAYVEWGQSGHRQNRLVQERKEWISSLNAGRNPFDEQVLSSLREEDASDPLIDAEIRLRRNIPGVLEWLTEALSDPGILAELRRRNAEAEQGPDAAAWQTADEQWQAGGAEELVSEIQARECSAKLLAMRDNTRTKYGEVLYLEIFLTDQVGRNACQTARTSDYLQSDEAWWISAFETEATSISKIQLDKSAGSNSISVHIPIMDQGAVIGVAKAVLDVPVLSSLDGPIAPGVSGPVL